jgi:hypothetical protein
MEEMMVPSGDAGIEIFVRNKRPADMVSFRPERTLLYVHGATYPSSTAFDLQLGGMSWMDYIAAHGYDVYHPRRHFLYHYYNQPGDKQKRALHSWRHRSEGHFHGCRFHPQASQHPSVGFARLSWVRPRWRPTRHRTQPK